MEVIFEGGGRSENSGGVLTPGIGVPSYKLVSVSYQSSVKIGVVVGLALGLGLEDEKGVCKFRLEGISCESANLRKR